MSETIESIHSELAEVKHRAANDILTKNEEIQALRRELEATRRAKQENDERFQVEAAEAREDAKAAHRMVRSYRSEVLHDAANALETKTLLCDDCPCVNELRKMASEDLKDDQL